MARGQAILVVDDQPDSLETLRLVISRTRVRVRGPWDISDSDLQDADLIVVDLNLTEWDERRGTGVLGTWSEDGLALIVVLRAHTERLDKTRPTSFTLQSS